MATEGFIQIQPLEAVSVKLCVLACRNRAQAPARIAGLDVGSTTCKFVLVSRRATARAGLRTPQHQAGGKGSGFSEADGKQYQLTPEQDRVFFTGSGAGLIAPLVGGKVIQEVVAVAAAVEKVHPSVRFVSEIGGEDMKTIFFSGGGANKSKQVLMQTACSGGTGTFIEKTARKLEITYRTTLEDGLRGLHAAQNQQQVRHLRRSGRQHLAEGWSFRGGDHRLAVRGCGLSKPCDSHARQHAASGNSFARRSRIFSSRVCRKPGATTWPNFGKSARSSSPKDRDPASLILVPDDALYYAAQGCIEVGLRRACNLLACIWGWRSCNGGLRKGSTRRRKNSAAAAFGKKSRAESFQGSLRRQQRERRHGKMNGNGTENGNGHGPENGDARQRASVLPSKVAPSCQDRKTGPVVVGCDFGSTTAKAFVSRRKKNCSSPAMR